MAAEQPAASSQQQFIAAAAAASQRCKDYGYRAEVPQQADSSAKRCLSFVHTGGFPKAARALLVYLLKSEVCALVAGSAPSCLWGTSRSHSQIWAPEADCCQPLPHLSDGAGRQPVPPACRPGFHQLDFEPPSRCRCRCSGRHRAATVWLREVSRGKRHSTTVDHRRSRRSRLPSNAAGAATLDPGYAGAATERSQPCGPMSKPRRVWPASAARAADLPMLPEA